MKNNIRYSGFTLVELSIVLIIIGLIVGGVVGGASIVKQAKIKKVISEYRNIQTVTNMFKDKYDYWPGDLPTASSYWPGKACNGNGDGVPRWDQGDTSSCGTVEMYLVSQHLALAGFIPGSFDGLPGTGRSGYENAVSGKNCIPSKFGNKVCFLVTLDINSNHAITYPVITGTTTGGQYSSVMATFTAEEAQQIDKALDDGDPANGKVLGWSGSGAPNICSGTTYNVTNKTVDCMVPYFLD